MMIALVLMSILCSQVIGSGISGQQNIKFLDGIPTYTVLGNLTLQSDYRQCNLFLSLKGDTAGLGIVYVAYTYNTRGVPCVFRYGSWTDSLLIADSSLTQVKQTSVGGGMYNDGTQFPFSNSTVGCFPLTYSLNCISLTSPDASAYTVGMNSIPYITYGASDYAMNPVSNLIFYVYFFQMQFSGQMFGILAWDPILQAKNSSYSYSAAANQAPLTQLFALSGGQVAFLSQPASNLSLVVISPNQYNAQTFPILIPDGSTVLDAQLSPSNPSGEILLLIGLSDPTLTQSSVLLRVDALSGQILGKAPVLNSTCLVVGWQNYVVAASPNNDQKNPVIIQMLTSDDLQPVSNSTYALPFIGHYYVNGLMNPVSGTFSTGFENNNTAILYLSTRALASWLYSVKITIN